MEKLKNFTKLKLSASDCRTIEELVKRARGPAGPVYDLERQKHGKHAAIMKYNLNRIAPDAVT